MVLEAMRRHQVSLESLWPELQAERRHPWRQVGFDALESAGMGLESVLEVRWADLEKASQKPPETASLKTVAQIVRDGEGPNLDQIGVSGQEVPLIQPDGTVQFAAIYQAANLPWRKK